MLKKEKSAVEDGPRKSWCRIKAVKGSSIKKKYAWRFCLMGSTKQKEALQLLGLRGIHQYSDQRSSRIRVPCEASTAAGTEREED